eukprot:scaffold102_cov340-Pavlova_lutheri.AAC.63
MLPLAPPVRVARSYAHEIRRIDRIEGLGEAFRQQCVDGVDLSCFLRRSDAQGLSCELARGPRRRRARAQQRPCACETIPVDPTASFVRFAGARPAERDQRSNTDRQRTSVRFAVRRSIGAPSPASRASRLRDTGISTLHLPSLLTSARALERTCALAPIAVAEEAMAISADNERITSRLRYLLQIDRTKRSIHTVLRSY